MTVPKERRMRTKSLVAIGACVLAVVMPAASAAAHPGGLSRARAGTAAYHHIDTARAAG